MEKIEVITTGSELLRGAVANRDLAIIGEALARRGLAVGRSYVAGDRTEEIQRCLALAAEEGETILITGGLGSTGDDCSREAVAEFFGLELEESPELRRRLLGWWRARHETARPPRRYFRQALLPRGAEALDNRVGSAPGLCFRAELGGRSLRIFLLPGPPRELVAMMEQVLTRLEPDTAHTLGFLAAGCGELTVEDLVADLALPEEVSVAYCATAAGTRVFFSGSDPVRLRAELERLRAVCPLPPLPVGALEPAPALLAELERRGAQLAVAESCTGGGLGAELTAAAGASAVFLGGVIAYDNRIKHQLLGVPTEVLERCGAVSAECAEALAAGVAQRLGAEAALAITGIAGPGGGTAEKPVGLVYIGGCWKGEVRVERHQFQGDRETVRERARARALLLLWRWLRENPETA